MWLVLERSQHCHVLTTEAAQPWPLTRGWRRPTALCIVQESQCRGADSGGGQPRDGHGRRVTVKDGSTTSAPSAKRMVVESADPAREARLYHVGTDTQSQPGFLSNHGDGRDEQGGRQGTDGGRPRGSVPMPRCSLADVLGAQLLAAGLAPKAAQVPVLVQSHQGLAALDFCAAAPTTWEEEENTDVTGVF